MKNLHEYQRTPLERLVIDWRKRTGKKFRTFAGAVDLSEGHLRRILKLQLKPKDGLALRIAEQLGKQRAELRFKGDDGTTAIEEMPMRIEALLVSGGHGVYRTSNTLYQLMKHRAVSIIAATGPQAPKRFMEGLAEKMKELAQREQLDVFQAYLLLDPGQIGDYSELKRRFLERHTVFEECGVSDFVQVFVCEVSPPTNLDFFIVDKEHIAFAIKGLRSEGAAVCAVEFRDRPEIAGAILDWFLAGAGKKAKPLQQWLRENEPNAQVDPATANVQATEVTKSDLFFDQAMALFSRRFRSMDVLAPEQFARLLPSAESAVRSDALLVARTDNDVSGAIVLQYHQAAKIGLICYASAERGRNRGYVTKLLGQRLNQLLQSDDRYAGLDCLVLETDDPQKYRRDKRALSRAVGSIRIYQYIAGLCGWHLRCLGMRYALPCLISPPGAKVGKEFRGLLWLLSHKPIPATLNKNEVEHLLSRLWIALYGSNPGSEEDGNADALYVSYIHNLYANFVKHLPEQIQTLSRADLERVNL